MERNQTKYVIAIWLAAILLRVGMAYVNPPNNSFDDHLEVISHYAINGSRPHPSGCWECYQPPLYYWSSAKVHYLAYFVTDSLWLGWKSVQAANVVYSLAHLLIVWQVLQLVGATSKLSSIMAFSVIAFLPRDIYTAAFVSNDTMCVLWTGLSVLLYLRLTSSTRYTDSLACMAALSASVVLASWTKQSGLLALILLPPAALFIARAAAGGHRRSHVYAAAALAALSFALALADEGTRISDTGIILASNQDFFDWAQDQKPGDLSLVSFADFKPRALWDEPVLSPSTVASFWTELFARLWYDYEPKFLPSSEITHSTARAAYAAGLCVCLLWLTGFIRCVFQWIRAPWRLPVLVLHIGFLAVPILQAIRFPVFSSMKATFILPACVVAAVCLSFGFELLMRRRVGRIFAVGLICLIATTSVSQTISAHSGIHERLAQGPIWPFPPMW